VQVTDRCVHGASLAGSAARKKVDETSPNR
jgi:hypothetical protein